ncbi:hypothetical protein [Chryseobacterium sp. FH1]|uniref:hypothetical protein n=1 Tax=Chryseobacterium sp. FH1 TaxID=1233951 RepID=UPI000ADEA042|nr:hypothetical protein [Chryseobacterium sp. FH1]
MKKKLLLFALQLSALTYAQVGINTDAPKTTFDVNSKTGNTDIAGLQAPRLTRLELTNKGNTLYGQDQKGALIYVSDINSGDSLGQRINIVSVGYYYFDGSLWQKVMNNSESIGSADWKLIGNSGTDHNLNFIGTTDDVSLRFKVNNINSGWIGKDINDNTSFGYNSLTGSSFSTPGSSLNNVAIGMNTLSSASSAFTWSNIAIGNNVLKNATDPRYNTAIGDNSQANLTTGRNNVSVGVGTLGNVTTGGLNTAIGGSSLSLVNTGSANTAIGLSALNGTTTGGANIGVGLSAGGNITTGGYNIVIGSENVNVADGTKSAQLNIGDLIRGQGMTRGIYPATGAIENKRVGINLSSTEAITATLHVKPTASDDPARIESLKTGTNQDKLVLADSTTGVLRSLNTGHIGGTNATQGQILTSTGANTSPQWTNSPLTPIQFATINTTNRTVASNRLIGSSVTLSPGKWVIHIGQLVRSSSANATNNMWMRITLSSSNTNITSTGYTYLASDYVSGWLSPSDLAGQGNSVLTGVIPINVTAPLTIYTWFTSCESTGTPPPASVGNNRENYMFAVPAY